MKNTILSFLLGVFITISFASNTPNNFITIKPSQSKSIIKLHDFNDVKEYCKKGYILTHVAGDYHRFYIMQKY